MNIVILTNDNYFSFTVLKDFLKLRKEDVKLVVFSSAVVGKKSTTGSIKWVLKNTGLRHTLFKVIVYGVFRFLRLLCNFLPFVPNNYSSYLWVKRNGIDHVFTSNVNSPEVVAKIREANPDLVVSVSMNQIVKEQILEMPPKKCINVHCAPLPRYGGMSPYIWALSNNEDYSAATTHYMTRGLDEGDIITQSKVYVKKNDSAFSLFYRCCLEARRDIVRIVDEIEDGTVQSYEQDMSQQTYFSWPTKECIESLKSNGYVLARLTDYIKAIFASDGITKPSTFVTYGWCRSSYAAVSSLGSKGIDVHVGDASSFAMSRFSRYCKSFTKLPDFFVEPEKYFEVVCDALKKTGAKVLMPGHEDVGIFSEKRDLLPEGVVLALPDFENYTLAVDKARVLDVAKQVDCPAAVTTTVDSFSELDEKSKTLDYPVVIKTRAGNSAKGVRVVNEQQEMLVEFKGLIEKFTLADDRWPIIQEYLAGDAVGVCLIYADGRCQASFTERYIRCKRPNKFGTSTLRESYKDEELISRAISIMDKIGWDGVAHLDFIADEKGTFKLIEINPRLWGALSLSIHAGVDFPYLWYMSALGEKILPECKMSDDIVRSRWIVGDMMAVVELLMKKQFGKIPEIFKINSNCSHDDFNIKDPVPFVFELADYMTKFVRHGFSTNPVTENMIK